MKAHISPLSIDDLSAISAVHQAAFPASALTRLGAGAVQRYYAWLLSGPHEAVCLGAWVEGKLAGFCFGGKFRGALSGFLRKHRAYLTWRVLTHPWLIGLPEFRERLQIAGRIFRRQAATAPAPQISQPSFGILAIATHPRFQGQGVGRDLMEASEFRAREQNYAQMHLTVSPNNQQAIRFYESLGWSKTPNSGNQWRGLMQKSLSAS